MIRGGIGEAQRIRPTSSLELVPCLRGALVLAYHVEGDDILERDTTGLVFCDKDLIDLDGAASGW